MTELTDRVCATYLSPTARHQAYNRDPTYHHQFTRVARVLDLVDGLLTDAGHDHTQRREMLELLLEGPGDPAAAFRRVVDNADAWQELMNQPPQPIVISREEYQRMQDGPLPADTNPRIPLHYTPHRR